MVQGDAEGKCSEELAEAEDRKIIESISQRIGIEFMRRIVDVQKSFYRLALRRTKEGGKSTSW